MDERQARWSGQNGRVIRRRRWSTYPPQHEATVAARGFEAGEAERSVTSVSSADSGQSTTRKSRFWKSRLIEA
jgi:hypothetical protein